MHGFVHAPVGHRSVVSGAGGVNTAEGLAPDRAESTCDEWRTTSISVVRLRSSCIMITSVGLSHAYCSPSEHFV